MGESGDRPDEKDDDVIVDVTEENKVVDLVPRQRTEIECIPLRDEDVRLLEAYAAYEAIIGTRQAPSTTRAIINEAKRKPPPIGRAITVGMLWLGGALMTFSFFFALATIPVAVAVHNWDNIRDALRLRGGSQRLLSAVPEFRNPWLVMTNRLVKIIFGFNVRAEAVNTFRGDGLMPESTETMARLLAAVRPDLLRIKAILRKFEPYPGADIHYETAGYASRLRKIDPLGIAGEAPPYAWLESDFDFIEAEDFETVLGNDLESIAACAEMAGERNDEE